MDINKINEMLQEGKSVKEIRTILNISEKKFQKQIRDLNYKYNQKIRAYEPIGEVLNAPMINYSNKEVKPLKSENKITTLTTTQKTTIDYLTTNLDDLKKLIEAYKKSIQENNADIFIDLPNDKHLNPKPKSVRINQFVWDDWLEFTKDLPFPKGDIIS